MPKVEKKGFKKATNTILITDDGERIDLRKVEVGRLKKQRNPFENRMRYYGARTARYNGHTYHSQSEAVYARDLDIRLKSGQIKAWEKQLRMPLIVNNQKICTYIVDFLVYHNNGTREYVEIKGFMTEVARLKTKLFEALYVNDAKGITYTIIKV